MFEIGYRREIPNTDWVSEIIIERFDAAFELLSPNSVIYGGAVRDALAGKTLEGDLDVSIPPSEFNELIQTFHESARWKPITESKSPGRYGERHIPMIRSMVEFEGIKGVRAQLICSSDNKSSAGESALYIPRNVDIICCGVFINRDGKVYEVIEGAYDDCKSGVLRLNKNMSNPHAESLKERSAKLEKRGWVNQINMRDAIRLERKKRPQDPRLKKPRKTSWPLPSDPVNLSEAVVKQTEDDSWRQVGKWYADETPVDPGHIKTKEELNARRS